MMRPNLAGVGGDLDFSGRLGRTETGEQILGPVADNGGKSGTAYRCGVYLQLWCQGVFN